MTCICEGRVVLVPCPQIVTVTLVQQSVDLKQTHKAELIFNLVLFNFLKIKSSLSKLFELSLQLNAVDSHLGECKVKTSTTQMQRVGRRAQGPSRSSGLLSRGSMGA